MYLLPCACGHELPILPGQAGQVVRCPVCSRGAEAPSLSLLCRMSAVDGSDAGATLTKLSRPAIVTVFLALSVSAVVLLWCAAEFGTVCALDMNYHDRVAIPCGADAWKQMVCLGAGWVCTVVAWALGAALFHRAFVQTTVIAGALALMAALGFSTLLHSQDAARRHTATDHLRRLGLAYQAANDYRTFDAGMPVHSSRQAAAQTEARLGGWVEAPHEAGQ